MIWPAMVEFTIHAQPGPRNTMLSGCLIHEHPDRPPPARSSVKSCRRCARTNWKLQPISELLVLTLPADRHAYATNGAQFSPHRSDCLAHRHTAQFPQPLRRSTVTAIRRIMKTPGFLIYDERSVIASLVG